MPMVISPQPKRRPGGRSAHVRAAVFAATLDELYVQGYEAMSIARIAAHAGVHETSIYRRWRTKAVLAVDALSTYAEQVLPIPDTGALHTDLTALLREVVQFLHSPEGAAMAQIAVTTGDDGGFAQLRSAFWKGRFTLLDAIAVRAVTRGELSPQVDARLLIETVIGPIYVRALFTRESLDDAMIERIVTLVLGGVNGVHA